MLAAPCAKASVAHGGVEGATIYSLNSALARGEYSTSERGSGTSDAANTSDESVASRVNRTFPVGVSETVIDENESFLAGGRGIGVLGRPEFHPDRGQR
jgi:hypothetical protein